MRKKWLWPAAVLLVLVLSGTSCVDISCTVWESGQSGQPATTARPSTTYGESYTPTSRSTTTWSTTTTSSSTTTSSTTTTLGPVDAYKAQMRAWKNTYAADMARYYEAVSGMRNPLKPSTEEVQAAKDLDALLADMVRDLEAIRAPARHMNPHADYLASMKELARGVHDLAQALDDGKSYQIVKAIADIAIDWEQGEPARKAMEQALGFSLSSQD